MILAVVFTIQVIAKNAKKPEQKLFNSAM